jgi:chromosomal replication initiation ATPase DnaA
MDAILHAVCEHYGMEEEDVLRLTQTEYARARHLAVYIIRKTVPGVSYATIGERFGNKRTSSTAQSAFQIAQERLTIDQYLRGDLNAIVTLLAHQGPVTGLPEPTGND